MNKVYAFENKERIFGCFWEDTDGLIFMYLPVHSRQSIQIFRTHWESLMNRNEVPEYDKEFSELFNIAKWAFAGHSVDFDLAEVLELRTPMGSYHPRIWRGIPKTLTSLGYEAAAPSPLVFSAQKQAIVASASLFNGLIELFRYIEPDKKNDDSFGHRIRELLILACTEIESHWKSVFKQNVSDPGILKNLGTRDYVKLLPVLRLSEWRVTLKDYFGYRFIAPFYDWDASKPSQSLPWYDAYNSVKHDREGKFENAQLRFLIDAMAAVHIMLAAQWGPGVFTNNLASDFSPFHIVSIPRFDASEQYVCPSATDKVTLVQPIPFGLS